MNHTSYQPQPTIAAPRLSGNPLKTVLLVFCGSMIIGAIPILYTLVTPTQTAPTYETVWSPLGR